MVTFTFSEAPVGFTPADITAVGGTLSGLAATADPLVYTATFTADRQLRRHRLGLGGGRHATPTRPAMPAARAQTRWRSTATNPTVTVDIVDSSLSDGDPARR